MDEFIEPSLNYITKKNLLKYTDNCEPIRIGYNAIIYSNCKNSNEIVKICLSGQLDFLMEVYAMSILGTQDISPKLIEYYWCNENIKLKDIVSESTFDENKKKRRLLNYEKEYEGVGIIIMEKIDNIISKSEDGGRIPLLFKSIVFEKIMHAYELGFIPIEPDVLIFIDKENYVDGRILDWGNYEDIEQSKEDYNEKNLDIVLDYLGLTDLYEDIITKPISNKGDAGSRRKKTRSKRRKSRGVRKKSRRKSGRKKSRSKRRKSGGKRKKSGGKRKKTRSKRKKSRRKKSKSRRN